MMERPKSEKTLHAGSSNYDLRLSAGFADNCGAGVPPAQDVVVESGRRDARTTNLAESLIY